MVNLDRTSFEVEGYSRLATISSDAFMKKQYLQLSAYTCKECKGPVVSGLLAVRESEISKETEIRRVGAMCLACGHRQNKVAGLGTVRKFAPVEWGWVNIFDEFHRAVAPRGNE